MEAPHPPLLEVDILTNKSNNYHCLIMLQETSMEYLHSRVFIVPYNSYLAVCCTVVLEEGVEHTRIAFYVEDEEKWGVDQIYQVVLVEQSCSEEGVAVVYVCIHVCVYVCVYMCVYMCVCVALKIVLTKQCSTHLSHNSGITS